MKPIASLVEEDRAAMTDVIRRVGDKPFVLFVTNAEDAPDYGFAIISPDETIRPDGFLSPPVGTECGLPDQIGECELRALEFGMAFEHNFAVILSPDMRIDMHRSAHGLGWSMHVLVRAKNNWLIKPLADFDRARRMLKLFFENTLPQFRAPSAAFA